MKCDICGKDTAHQRQVTRSYGKGAGILVVENIPSMNCSSCGQSYFEAQTLHEIERIKSNRRKFAVKRSLAVAVYA
jgi:YgiT-type zinc finger domain-containing protein